MKASELMAALESGQSVRRLPDGMVEEEVSDERQWLYCTIQDGRVRLWGFGSAVSSTDEHIIGIIMLYPEKWTIAPQ